MQADPGCGESIFNVKLSLPGNARADVRDDHVIGITGERFAVVGHVANVICHVRDRGVQIQFAAIIGEALMPRKMKSQIAKRLIRLLANRIGKKFLANDRRDFLFLLLKHKLADLIEHVTRTVANIIVRLAGPECVFVELNPLIDHAAEDLGAHVAVADGERLLIFPLARCRMGVPEAKIVIRDSRAREEHRKQQDQMLHPNSSLRLYDDQRETGSQTDISDSPRFSQAK